MKVAIGVLEENLEQVSDLLHILLADEMVLYTKTRGYYWNFEGANFYCVHLLLESQSNELSKIVDSIAKRIKQLGYSATASMEAYLKSSRLSESPPEGMNNATQWKTLVDDHETIIRILRNDILKCGIFMDLVSANFITGLVERHEQMVWMLRASLTIEK